MSKVSERTVLEGGLYTTTTATGTVSDISARSTVTDFNGDTVDCRKLSRLSFTCQWTADSGAARVGNLKIQTTDDPRAIADPGNAAWNDRTLQAAGYDGDATESGVNAALGTAAGKEQFAFTDLPAYCRLIWDNTTAGTDGAITIWLSGR